MTSKPPKHRLPILKFCGYSGSGKTTLVERLIATFSKKWRIGYIKHDAHQIKFDVDGKDTHKVFEAGASAVLISDTTQSMMRFHQPTPESRWSAAFRNCDFAFAEGWKYGSGPKIVVIDSEEKILEEVRSGQISDVIAFIGPKVAMEFSAPYFQRDDFDRISSFVNEWIQKNTSTTLYGLVLAGGRSQRMHRDKSTLRYHDVTQAQYCFNLLTPLCSEVYISCREGQLDNSDVSDLPQLHDRFFGFGPLGGILTAFESRPNSAWLVIACDLPFLKNDSLEHLVKMRNLAVNATCFIDSESKLPEPLCAIYEPKIKTILYDYLQQGTYCPRKILINEECQRLDAIDIQALMNANNPLEYETALAEIRTGAAN